MDSGLLQRNLKALAFQNPSLALRLCEPVGSDHIELFPSPSGELTARFTRLNIPVQCLENPVKSAEKAVEEFVAQERWNVFCFGVGLGYELALLLKKIPRERRIVAYEQDPWLLRMCLSLHDFSRPLLTRNLSLLLGADVIPWWRQEAENFRIFYHPWLQSAYRPHWERLRINTDSPRRVLVAAGGLFIDDVADALQQLGCHVWLWDPQQVSLEETRRQIKTFDPRFVLSINFIPGLASLCEDIGMNYVAWEIDPTVERLKPHKTKATTTKIFTYRKARIPHYKESGYQAVEYLPLATNPRRRYPMMLSKEELERYEAPISFVGSSMLAQAQTLRRLFEETCLLHGLNPEEATNLSRPVPGHDGRLLDLGLCAAEEKASAHRRRIVGEVLEMPYGCKIWGDDGWAEMCPPSVYQGPAKHGLELTKIYNASWINLDIARAYQNDIVTMRVFDVLACQAFVLAEHSPAIGELFDIGRDVVVYRNRQEIRKLIHHYIRNPEERVSIARAGHERVLKDHTMDQRMAWILQYLG
ncbi:MAG: glycosyltransferase [Desulfosoma sp.]